MKFRKDILRHNRIFIENLRNRIDMIINNLR